MKAVVLVLLMLVVFVSSQGVKFSKTVHVCLKQDGEDAFNLDLGDIPIGLKQYVTFTMNTTHDVGVCVQQYVTVKTFEECNPKGKLYFNTTKSLEERERFESSVLEFDNFHRRNKQSVKELSYGLPQTVLKTVSLRSGNYNLYARFLGVVANNASCFTLRIEYEACDNTHAPPYHAGLNCAPINQLVEGAVVLSPNADNDYFFNVGKNIGFFLLFFNSLKSDFNSPTECNANLTITVRRGGAVYEDDYDVEARCEDGKTVVSFDSPYSDIYFIKIKNSSPLQTTTNTTSHQVVCEQIAFGPNCTTVPSGNDLTSGTGKAALIKSNAGKTDFYLVKNSELTVGVGVQRKNDKDNTNAPDIIASFGNFPAKDHYLIGSSGRQVNLLWASAMPKIFADSEWYIAVTSDKDYYIWSNAQCPNNCSSHGSCNSQTGLCTCDKHYKKTLYCDKKTFPVIWIVLIAIAGAIILAVAIGVPVACYVKNKNKARYERV